MKLVITSDCFLSFEQLSGYLQFSVWFMKNV
jgi:hypothetical protein